MHVLENQYIILFFASLILKSMGKLLNFSEIVGKAIINLWIKIGKILAESSGTGPSPLLHLPLFLGLL